MFALSRIHFVAVLLGGLALTPFGCAKTTPAGAEFMATIAPLKMVLDEIVGDPGRVGCILPPGASPHTFELRPSTARQLDSARAVFYVDTTIDAWAAQLAPGRIHSVFALLPQGLRRTFVVAHRHEDGDHHAEPGDINAHFWSDPVAVKAVVPGIVDILAEADPENRARYEANAARFMASLDGLDAEFRAQPAPRPGYGLVAFHPSWCYFFQRYGIAVSDYVEPFPGKEPTPQTIQALEQKLSVAERRVVLSEVQLPAKSAEVLAETLDARITTIDPLGGVAGRDNYADLLRYNAALLREALQ